MFSASSISSVILIAAFAVSPSKDSPFNVDFFCGWGGLYRPMEWTPLEIEISTTLTEAFAGSVTVSNQQDGLNTLNIVHTFVLTPDIPLHLPLVTKFAFTADKCGIRITDNRGKTCWQQDFDLWNFSSPARLLTAVSEKDLLLGLVGNRKFGISRLPAQSICRSGAGREGTRTPAELQQFRRTREGSPPEGLGKVYIGDKLPRMLPWDWTGFAALDLLILYDPDWDRLNTHQLNAITQWVSNGGKLLIVLGTNSLPTENPIARLLPFEIKDLKQTTISSQVLEKFGLAPDESETVTCWSLTPKSAARVYQIEISETDDCLFATAYSGFGRIGILAFDPSVMSDRQKANSSKFWIACIASVLRDANVSPTGPEKVWTPGQQIPLSDRTIEYTDDADKSISASSRDASYYQVGLGQTANNAVMEHLYGIAQMRPLSIWWVVLLLTILAVLLGPVDYIVLKRKDRLPLTWLTCTFWIVLFTAGAYYGVRTLRGGRLQLRVVSVLDAVEADRYKWSTSYCGLFAPYSDDYQLEGTAGNQWWSGIAPTQEGIWAYNKETGSRQICCFQHDGGNLPYSLPVSIWTIQCLLNESPVEKLPFSAQVERRGNEIVLDITNESDSRIAKGSCLFAENQGIDFDSVPAHGKKQFRGSSRSLQTADSFNMADLRRYYQEHYGSYYPRFQKRDVFFAQGSLQRTRTLGAYLNSGAAVVCAEYEQAPVPFTVKNRHCTYDHIQMARLVLFPKQQ